jgi:hypothetical protein
MNTILAVLWFALTLAWSTAFLVQEGPLWFKAVVVISAGAMLGVKVYVVRNWHHYVNSPSKTAT